MAVKPSRINRNGYREIASVLRDRISSGRIAPGNFIATEKDLQLEFGAGRSTIRKVLSELVEEGWAVNVPKKGVFAGRGLRPVPGNTIAFVENDTFVHRLLGRRYDAGLKERGFRMKHVGGSENFPLEYALQQVLDGQYAGALVWCFHVSPNMDLVNRLIKEVPVVVLDHKLGKGETDMVTFDHEAAAYEATQHLIEQGCARIGITGMLDTLDVTNARILGYMRAMFDHDLQPDPRDFQFIYTSGLTSPRTEILSESLRSASRPDGLLVLQDFCAPAVVESALRAGLSLPKDLKLAALGDEFDVSVDGLGLTSISFDWMALADLSLDLLKGRLQDLHRLPQTRVAPHKLIVRGLSGATESQWTPDEDQPHPEAAHGLSKPRHQYQSSWRPIEGSASLMQVSQ